MTQEEFADYMGVTRQSVSRWEMNKAYPDIEKIIRICELYDVSVDYLLRGEESQVADASQEQETQNPNEQHLELTNLVIPGKNDSPELIDAYLDWVAKNLGVAVPLHFSAYHPAFRFRSAPPTPPALLRQIAMRVLERGFHHVHLGNI